VLTLSQTAGYAIMALSCLDPNGEEFIQEQSIADKTGISKPYLSKLIHKLSQAGILKGKRGYKGGIIFASDAKSITMMDVVDAIEGTEWRSKCLLGLPTCSCNKPCPVHEFWGKQRPKIEKVLNTLTFDQVIQKKDVNWTLL